MTEERKDTIAAACMMYDTAAKLFATGMSTDANSIATKAKLLLDRALDGLIEKPNSN